MITIPTPSSQDGVEMGIVSYAHEQSELDTLDVLTSEDGIKRKGYQKKYPGIKTVFMLNSIN